MKERKNRKILRPYKGAEKAAEHESAVIPILVGAHETFAKDLEKRLGALEIRGRIEII